MSVTARQAVRLWIKWHGRCYWCNDDLTPEILEFDHYVPKERGGSNDESNLVLSCAPCNRAKRDLPPRVAELWFRHGLPRCAAIEIHEMEQGLPPSNPIFMVGAQYIEKKRGKRIGKRRVVVMPMAMGGPCENAACPSCQ